LSHRRRSTQATLTSLSNRLKPFIQTVNITRITITTKATTVLTDRAVAAEAGRANAMFIRKRTAAREDTHQKNASALRKHTRHGLTQTKAVIATLRTGTDNIWSFVKKTIRTSAITPLKLLS
jgi:hypothetical protein